MLEHHSEVSNRVSWKHCLSWQVEDYLGNLEMDTFRSQCGTMKRSWWKWDWNMLLLPKYYFCSSTHKYLVLGLWLLLVNLAINQKNSQMQGRGEKVEKSNLPLLGEQIQDEQWAWEDTEGNVITWRIDKNRVSSLQNKKDMGKPGKREENNKKAVECKPRELWVLWTMSHQASPVLQRDS